MCTIADNIHIVEPEYIVIKQVAKYEGFTNTDCVGLCMRYIRGCVIRIHAE